MMWSLSGEHHPCSLPPRDTAANRNSWAATPQGALFITNTIPISFLTLHNVALSVDITPMSASCPLMLRLSPTQQILQIKHMDSVNAAVVVPGTPDLAIAAAA